MTHTKNIFVGEILLGDSGKGKSSADLSKLYDTDFTIRANASSNCGHQVYKKYNGNLKKYTHHLLPSVDYNFPKIKSFLARDMMINPQELYEEISTMAEDFSDMPKSIYVDIDAFIIEQKHIDEDQKLKKELGTTGKGAGPATRDKMDRKGTRIYDLINQNAEIIKKLKSIGVHFTTLLQMREEFEKSNLLFEAGQGMGLGLMTGIYPYVTSTECGISSIYNAGFHWIKLDRAYSVLKAGFMTKSGDNISYTMPTEFKDKKISDELRERGNEYGSTTGRARRIGVSDLMMAKYGIQQGGFTHLILTKLDIMDGEKTIKVCNSYGEGKNLYSPSDFLSGVNPQYIDLPGWNNSKNINEVVPFISYIENFLGIPVEYISTGISSDDLIKYDKNFIDQQEPLHQ